MIALRNVSFTYADSDYGVKEIDLSIQKGECVVLTGPSGGGKSTLTRVLNGLAPHYFYGRLSGTITIGNDDFTQKPIWEISRQIGSVFQDPKSQFFSSELAGEIAFATENYGLAHPEVVRLTHQAISHFKLNSLINRNLDDLSSGEKQRVAIASVYTLNPEIYVFDEPTANLDAEGVVQLKQTVSDLKSSGKTLIIAEHRLSWLDGIVDRFVYLKDGAITWEKTAKEMGKLTKKQRDDAWLRSSTPIHIPDLPRPAGQGSPLLSTTALSIKRGRNTILQNQNFKVWPGQIISVTGRNGAGKTTLALALAGLDGKTSGKIEILEKSTRRLKRRSRVWYSSNETGTQFFTNSVSSELLLTQNLTESTLEKARELLKRLGLYQYKDSHPATLSGGQRLRLSIACGLMSNREILIFDEPTSGLDGGNMNIVATLFRELAKSGKSILIITHDGELIKRCCDFSLPIA
ncbi:MAG: ABC transporter ATP-binding protein [Chloroflexota bacterium]